jgi:hypothetical protein
MSTETTIASATHDGFTVSSNSESADEIKANLEATEKPLDGEGADPKKEEADKVKRAASELGKKGGEAAAKARAEKKDSQAEEDEGEDESVDTPKDEKLGKPRHDPRARVMEATRKEAEARRQLAAEREEKAQMAARLERLEKIAARVAPEQEEQPSRQAQNGNGADPRPEANDFDDYADFTEARARWAAREEFRQQRQHAEVQHRARSYADAVTKHVNTFSERIKSDPEAIERIDPQLLELRPTFVLGPGERPTAANGVADEIMGSENALAIMLHLSENPDEIQGLMALPNQHAIARAIAKIEAKLGDSPTRQEKSAPASKAKPPVKPVHGAAPALDDDVSDDISFEQHMARMEARGRRGR